MCLRFLSVWFRVDSGLGRLIADRQKVGAKFYLKSVQGLIRNLSKIYLSSRFGFGVVLGWVNPLFGSRVKVYLSLVEKLLNNLFLSWSPFLLLLLDLVPMPLPTLKLFSLPAVQLMIPSWSPSRLRNFAGWHLLALLSILRLSQSFSPSWNRPYWVTFSTLCQRRTTQLAALWIGRKPSMASLLIFLPGLQVILLPPGISFPLWGILFRMMQRRLSAESMWLRNWPPNSQWSKPPNLLIGWIWSRTLQVFSALFSAPSFASFKLVRALLFPLSTRLLGSGSIRRQLPSARGFRFAQSRDLLWHLLAWQFLE